MNEQLLEKVLKEVAVLNLSGAFVFDIFDDIAFTYEVTNETIILQKKENLSSYLEMIKNIIREEFLSDYMNAISIPKLQDAIKSGKGKIEFEYQIMNGKWYKSVSILEEVNGKKLVVLLVFKISQDKFLKKQNDKGLVESVSDSILKIHNVFSAGSSAINNIKKVENYVDSILSQLTSEYPELKKSFDKNATNITGMVDETILIVDDDLITRNMIKKVFADDYKVVMANNGKEAIDYLEANSNKKVSESIDNILGIFLDLTMPVMDGFAVLDYLSSKGYLSKLPVIIISGDYEKETKNRVYNYNIADMLEKPFDFQVVKRRIGKFINLYKSSNSLTSLISDQNSNIKSIINPFIETYYLDYEKNIKNIEQFIKILGKNFAKENPEYKLNEEKMDKIAQASKYYDVGFYSVPRSILMKKERLTEEELSIIKKYPLFSAEVVDYILSLTGDNAFKEYSKNIAKYYHENYDGSGYPCGLKADKIPVEAQLAGVCIFYNNLIRKENIDAKEFIIKKKGTYFNPKIVDSFLEVYDEIKNSI